MNPRDEVLTCPKCNEQRYHVGQIQRTELFERAWGYWHLNGSGFYEQVPMDRGQEGFRIRCSECGYTWLESVTP